MHLNPRFLIVASLVVLTGFYPHSVFTESSNSTIMKPNQTTDQDFNFIVYGDSRDEYMQGVSPYHDDIVESYLEQNPSFIIHSGDCVGRGGIWSQWLDFNESIAPVWEADIPFYCVVGNHEKYTDIYYQYDEDFSNYTTFFDFSDVAKEANETELYFSFDYEDVHFVLLNTEDYFDDTEDGTHNFNCSEIQMDWLISDLSNTEPDDLLVVIYHRPSWSIREDRPDRWEEAETVRAEFHSIFIDYGVDIVFNGHDHYYYRTLRDGIYYVVTGGGGAPLYGADTEAPIWQSSDVAHSQYHYCNVIVNSTHMVVDVLKTDDSLLDSFTVFEQPSATTTSPTSTSTPSTPTSPVTIDPFRVPLIVILVGVSVIAIIAIVVIWNYKKG